MYGPSEVTRTSWSDRILGALVSLPGMLAAQGVLLSTCIAMLVVSERTWDASSSSDASAQISKLREGYILLSEIEQLVLATIAAERRDRISEAHVIAFDHTARKIEQRIKLFQEGSAQSPFSVHQAAVVSSLKHLLTIIHEIQSQEFTDLSAFTNDLVAASHSADSQVLKLLSAEHESTVGTLQEKTAIMHSQQSVLEVFLVVLTVCGCGGLFLHRREFLERLALKEAKSRIQHMVSADTLTDLPNRNQFKKRLSLMLEERRQVALLLVDVTDFKSINEKFGHDAGDKILCRLADCLRFHSETAGGFAARLGGDEFALVVPDDDINHLNELVRSLLNAIETPYMYELKKIHVSACIGFATASQINSSAKASLDLLTRVADFALQNAKQRGRGQFMVYDEALEFRHRNQRAMLEELPVAIRTGHLKVFLQPKVALPSGEVLGFEALVRWDRNGQLLPPGEFIDLAEESGLVIDIDRYVLNRATKLVSQWNRKNGTDFYVAVNLSAHHFASDRIINDVEEALWNSGLPASQLILEITETVEMRDWTQASEIIQGLKGQGAKIAIDDFGTGFSSLAFIMAIDADELKIDRSLVDELETSQQARRLLGSVADIAGNLNLSVTVEGIETERQSEIVVKLGATTGQGYLFGKPKPGDEALCEATGELQVREKAKLIPQNPMSRRSQG